MVVRKTQGTKGPAVQKTEKPIVENPTTKDAVYDEASAAFDEVPMSEISLLEFETMIDEYAKAKEILDNLAHQKTKAQEVVDMHEAKVLQVMQAHGKTSYRASCGLLVKSERWSWKTPKTDEEKTAFYNYLQSKGLFDTMISVNSATLNSFCKKEYDAAVADGNPFFTIPGLQPPSVQVNISLRR